MKFTDTLGTISRLVFRSFTTIHMGCHVKVVTDHKLLVATVQEPLSKAPNRLQALLIPVLRPVKSDKIRQIKHVVRC